MGCVSGVLGRLSALEARVASIDSRLASLEARLESVEVDVDNLGDQVADQDTSLGNLREECGDFFELVRDEFREMGRMDEQA